MREEVEGERPEKAEDGGGNGATDEEENGRPEKPVPRVWDRPDDQKDPPSQRPEDTVEEERRRRKAG